MDTIDRHSPVISPHLLDFFFGVAVMMLVSAALSPGRPFWAMLVALSITGILTVLWTLWRNHESRNVAIMFAAVSLASYAITDSTLSVATQWVALIILELSVGRRASYVHSAIIVAFTVAVHISSGSGLTRTFSEGLAALALTAAGISVAVLMKRADVLDSERRRALQELEETNGQLRQALHDSRDLALAQERERIATALHDGLGHRLTSIGISLDFAQRILGRDGDRAREEIAHARESASLALDEMRTTVRAMAPLSLRPGGVVDTLADLAESFNSTGLDVSFSPPTLERMPEPNDQATLLMLSFTQEALTNVIRHAEADSVLIELTPTHLSVSDNGHGHESSESTGYGIRSLTNRASQLGGSVEVENSGGINGGFRLTLHLPEIQKHVEA